MLIVYGAEWCKDTKRAARHLERLGVEFQYRDVDADAAALERAKSLNHGERRTPTIDLNGEVLVEPSNAELTAALARRHVRPADALDATLRRVNVGALERGLRVVAGATATAYAMRMSTPWRWPLAAWGMFEIASGIAGTCPVYTALGMNSLGGPGDHPREAERWTWLAPTGVAQASASS